MALASFLCDVGCVDWRQMTPTFCLERTLITKYRKVAARTDYVSTKCHVLVRAVFGFFSVYNDFFFGGGGTLSRLYLNVSGRKWMAPRTSYGCSLVLTVSILYRLVKMLGRKGETSLENLGTKILSSTWLIWRAFLSLQWLESFDSMWRSEVEGSFGQGVVYDRVTGGNYAWIFFYVGKLLEAREEVEETLPDQTTDRNLTHRTTAKS